MKFIERLRRDKPFRFKVVAMVVLIILIFNSSAPKKEAEYQDQAVCNQANTWEDGQLIATGFAQCPWEIEGGVKICMPIDITGGVDVSAEATCLTNTCVIGRYAKDGYDPHMCLKCVYNGLRAQASTNCCYDFLYSEYKDGYNYLCKAFPPGVDPSTIQCNSAEQGIADILLGMWSDFPGNCKTAYYAVIFGGGMMLLMMLGMFL